MWAVVPLAQERNSEEPRLFEMECAREKTIKEPRSEQTRQYCGGLCVALASQIPACMHVHMFIHLCANVCIGTYEKSCGRGHQVSFSITLYLNFSERVSN